MAASKSSRSEVKTHTARQADLEPPHVCQHMHAPTHSRTVPLLLDQYTLLVSEENTGDWKVLKQWHEPFQAVD